MLSPFSGRHKLTRRKCAISVVTRKTHAIVAARLGVFNVGTVVAVVGLGTSRHWLQEIGNGPIQGNLATFCDVYIDIIASSACIPVGVNMITKVQHHAGECGEFCPHPDYANRMTFPD